MNGSDRFHRAVLVEVDGDDVAAELIRPVPRAVAGKEDGVLVFLREHVAGIEAQAQGRPSAGRSARPAA